MANLWKAVLVGSLYWLVAAPGLSRFTLSLFPPEQRMRTARVLTAMGHTMGAFVRAFVLEAMAVGVLTYVGLTLLGMPYAAVLATLAALGEIVPIAGPILAGIPAVAIAFVDSPEKALAVLIFYVVLQQIESNVLIPLLVQQQAHIPPALTIFALAVGVAMAGLIGALVAIPAAGAVRVFVIDVVAPAIRRWSGAADAPADVGVPPAPA